MSHKNDGKIGAIYTPGHPALIDNGAPWAGGRRGRRVSAQERRALADMSEQIQAYARATTRAIRRLRKSAKGKLGRGRR